MTNAELEVIEVAFIRPLNQTATQAQGMYPIIVPITSGLRGDIAGK